MYLRRLFDDSALSGDRGVAHTIWSGGLDRGEYGALMNKPPTTGEILVLPERHDKAGGTILAPNTNLTGAGTIAAPPSTVLVGGVIDGTEIEAWQIDLVAGQTYMFSVFGSGANPLGDTFLYLLDDAFGLINYDDDGGAGVNSLLTFTATATGTYYIGVGAYPGSGEIGEYTLDAILSPGVDVVPDTDAGAVALDIGGVTYGFIEETAGPGPYGPNYGEVDTYSFTAEAGLIYTFEVAGGADYESLFFDLPPGELDTVITIRDADGNIIAANDDISFPSDINSGFSFFAAEAGTYYLDVFSWQPWSGGYSITTSEINPADYNILDALQWQSAENVQFDECGTAYVYFAAAGETFGEIGDDGVSPLISLGWNDWEMQQVMEALEQYENVLGVNYEITTDASQATFRLITTESDFYGAYMYPQDPAFGTQQGIAAFNVLSGGWAFDAQQSLVQGGFSFSTILHEFGHGHGLAHPHDNGGGSDVMLGVTGPFDSFGVYDLNQGVYTVMSYNDAWTLHPDGPSPFTAAGVDNGWTGTLSALDIAALQARYGANTSYARGNDTYVLNDVQEQGTYYETIWDTRGRDTIRYDGARAARIDLTAATIDYTPTGGGVISFVDGIWGGFTIAQGVVIENATGGSGADELLGNDAANELKGNDGDDFLMGRGGGDKMDGGAGFDVASYIDSDSGVQASLSENCGSHGDARGDSFKNIEGLQGSKYNDLLQGDKKDNTLDGLAGDDKLYGEKGADTLSGGDGNDKLYGGKDNDTIDGGAGNDVLSGDHGRDTFVFNLGDGADKITDFKKGDDTIDLQGLDLTFALLDSNGNGKLDDGDTYVTVSHGDTTIDLGAAGGGLAGVDTLKIEDVTNLKDDSFVF